MLTRISLKLLPIVLLACNSYVIAQPKGFTAIKDVATFEQSFAKANAATNTIISDFSQTQHLSLMKEKIRSKGKFYYSKPDKLRIEYTSPYTYLVVMNAGHLLVKDENKTSKINTRNSKMMQSINRIMVDCMNGKLMHNPDFKATAYESAGQYLLMLVPTTPAMKKIYSGLDVYLQKANYDVVKISMNEVEGDHTDMEFTNTRRNTPLNETLFKAK